LKVQPPPPVHELLPDIQPVIPLSRLKDAFKRIVNLAFISQGRPDLKQIVSS